MKKMLLVLGLAAGGVLGGCKSDYFVTQRFATDRAELDATPVAVPPEPVKNVDPSGPALPGVLEPVVTGTWTYTVPTTVTRMEKRGSDVSQASLYVGRPAPTDVPFVVITIGSEEKSAAETDSAEYTIIGTRTYVLNGNVAKEWTGHTKAGAAFCEMVVSRPGGGGDLCHAMAIASTEDERKEALAILGSITWKVNP